MALFAQLSLRCPRRWRALASASALALLTAGCLGRSPDVTGSIGLSRANAGQDELRRESETWGRRFEANPGDAAAGLRYAQALRGLGQHAQAVAVLQQAAMRSPKNLPVLGAYGKALADVGQYAEAADVLGRAHTPERPDWRILSAQGAVADQMGDHARAQQYYEAALRITPNDPTVLSNLGLSHALAKRLAEGERILSQAAALPGADARVRQNLALVLGLQGKFSEAEAILRRDQTAAEASANVAALRAMVSQPNSWAAIRKATGAKGAAATADKAAARAAPNG
jgi:Flp pilus assembly protein TadD